MWNNRRIPRSILYGSSSRQGLGVKDLHLLQGIHHINDIVDHTYKKSITGHLIQDSLEHLKLELGTNGPIFEKRYEDFKGALLHKSWVRDTWKFASDNNITFNENLSHFKKRRKYDCLLMERLFNHPDIPKQHIKPFNRCRIYLQAISLSDITTGDGSLITKRSVKRTSAYFSISIIYLAQMESPQFLSLEYLEKMSRHSIHKWLYSTIVSTTRQMVRSIRIMQLDLVYKFYHYLIIRKKG